MGKYDKLRQKLLSGTLDADVGFLELCRNSQPSAQRKQSEGVPSQTSQKSDSQMPAR
jgi:hypothetical protein